VFMVHSERHRPRGQENSCKIQLTGEKSAHNHQKGKQGIVTGDFRYKEAQRNRDHNLQSPRLGQVKSHSWKHAENVIAVIVINLEGGKR
jgi:hypothetical protein